MTASKTASAKKPAAKKAAAKKATAPKAAAKKTGAKKSAAKKTVRPKAPAKSAAASSPTVFLHKEAYKACMDGLLAQGLDREDAIETLKVGIRQANGRPVPPELLRSNGAPAKQGQADVEPVQAELPEAELAEA